MQPVFDDFNVDLSDVDITIGSKTGSAYTEGYHVTLTTPGNGPSSYDYGRVPVRVEIEDGAFSRV